MNIPAPLIRAILDYAARYKFHICMYVCIPKLLGDCPRQLLSALGDFCSSDPLINPRNPGTLDALYTVFRKKTPTHSFFYISMNDVLIETKIAVNIPKER